MRLGRLICGDIHFQWKYGFYFIYFILTVLYVCGIAAYEPQVKACMETLENGYCFYYDIL